MDELIKRYDIDLGVKIPESLLLIDRYKTVIDLTDRLRKHDNNKRSKHRK